MFFLNKRYFEPLLNLIVERGLKLRMWSYSRIDTVQPHYLDLFRRAGIGWLALGVEAANQMIRHEVSKGSFKDVNIRQVARTIREHGLNIIANYIFGFPEDTRETMQQTLDLALELNTEMVEHVSLPGPARQHALLPGPRRTAGRCRTPSRATAFFPMKASPCRRAIAPPLRSCVSATKPGRSISPIPIT